MKARVKGVVVCCKDLFWGRYLQGKKFLSFGNEKNKRKVCFSLVSWRASDFVSLKKSGRSLKRLWRLKPKCYLCTQL